MAGSDRRQDPAELSVDAAAERFIARKQGSLADATVREYGYRLRRFREWCDEAGIESVGELHPLDFDDFLAAREATGVQPVTLQKHFTTIREFISYLADLGAVADGLADAVPEVSVPHGGAVNDEMLSPADGDALLAWYRDSERYGTRAHVLLELIWTTGCRLGGVRALDCGDVSLVDGSVAFRHRPDTDTPLKNGVAGERVVAVSDAVVAVLNRYIDQHRLDRRDDAGREPLVSSTHGRPAPNTIRNWCYEGTVPCLHTDCPHGKERRTCEWTEYSAASKCPSSRAPTAVKTGAITRMLNRGVDRDRIAHRANTRQWANYDAASEQTKLEARDRAVVSEIELDTEGSDS